MSKKYEIIAEYVLKYLEKNGTSTAKKIKEAIIQDTGLNFAKSTYYDSLSFLLEQERILPFEKNGEIRLNAVTRPLPSDEKLYGKIKKTDIDNWLILFVLENEGHPMTAKQIKEKCWEVNDLLIYDRLKHLENDGIVTKSKNSDSVYVFSPAQNSLPLLNTNYKKMMEYACIYHILGAESALDNFADRLKSITGIFSDISVNTQGKSNVLRNKSIGCLASLLALPYKEWCIAFTTKTQTKQLAVGSILYSEDANEFYVLGKRGKRRDPEIIPLSSVTAMKKTQVKITVDENSFYKNYVDEMFEVEPGEPLDVEIHFRLTPDTERKLSQLNSNRPNATVLKKPQEKIIIYRDTIRGKNKLKRFLRSFGSDAIVISPEKLRNEMIDSAQKTAALYSRTGRTGRIFKRQ